MQPCVLLLKAGLSVCHTHQPGINGTRYRNTFCTIWQSDVSSFL